MRRTFKYFCLILITVLVSTPALAQIQISIPDTNAVDGDTLLIPVIVDSSLTGNDVRSLQMGITYSVYTLKFLSVETTGSLLEGWSSSVNPLTDEIRIAAAGKEALVGTGNLLFLKFKIIQSGGAYLNFNTSETFLNEGYPPLILEGSYVSIAQKPTISVNNPVNQMVVGDSVQHTVYYAEGDISWSTTNPSVATISETGMLKAISHGNVAAIAEDSRGIIDTSNVIKVFGFRLTGNDTTNFQGQTVSVDIKTTDLTALNIKSGEFFLASYGVNNNLEVLSVEAGELLSPGAMVNMSVSDGIKLAFAQSETITGAGTLLTLQMKLKEVTAYNYFSFQEILFNEMYEGLGQNFTVRSIDLPALSINPNYGAFLVGDSVQFSVSGNTGWVNWEVEYPELASINNEGLLVGQKGGVTKLIVTDSIGASGTTSNLEFFDVELTLPDTSMMRADTLLFPIRISNVERSGSSIRSIDFEITFSDNRLDFLGVTQDGSLSDGWFYSQNMLDQNTIKLVGAHSEGIQVSGDLLYLKFKTDTTVSSDVYAYLNFEKVLLNEGSPLAKEDNGQIFISTKPLVPVLVSPENGALSISLAPVLNWNKAVGADYYDVQLSTNSYFSDLHLDTTGVLTDELEVFNLESNTNYYWRVRALNDGGASNWSGYYWFKTQVPVPAAPMLGSPEDGAQDVPISTNIYWNSAEYATHYRVEVDTVSNFTTALIDSTVDAGTNNMMLPDLTYNITYYWRVFASNATGESEASQIWSFTTIPEIPAIPVLLSPTNGATQTDTLVYLSWNVASRADFYTYQLSTTGDFNSVIVQETVTDTVSSVGGLDLDTEYFWRVRAENAGGQSMWSTAFSFTTRQPDASIPTLLSPGNNATDLDTALTFSWNEADFATEYHYQLSSEIEFLNLKVDTAGLQVTSLVVDGLNYETDYYWRVRSIGMEDTSDWSSIFTFTTKRKVNQSPEIIRPLGSIIVEEDFSSFTVAVLDTIFTDPEGASLSYTLIDYDSTLFTATLNSDTLRLSSIANLYGDGQVVVQASDGESEPVMDTLYVGVWTVNDLPVFTNVPDTIKFRNDEEFVFRLDSLVTDVEDSINDLIVELVTNEDEVTASYNVDDFTITLSARGYSGKSPLTIIVTDSDGGEANTSIIIDVEMSTSTELQGSIPETFELYQNYPNPFNPTTQINFDLPEGAKVRIEVYSMLGQRVSILADKQYSAGRHHIRYDAASLSSGIYIYRIQAGNFVKTKRMTLIK